MKTAKFFLIFCLMFPLISSAQTIQKLKTDSLLHPNLSGKLIPRDSLKINLNSLENRFTFPINKPKSDFTNQNLALLPQWGQTKSNSKNGMPIYNPAFQSNMPVMKPDSTVHFHLKIAKIAR